jgi:hypothetical protein
MIKWFQIFLTLTALALTRFFLDLEATFWVFVIAVLSSILRIDEDIKNLTSVINHHSKNIFPNLYKDDK